ncbi:MAG: hypothetical protein J6Q76_07170 [Clostridia bacterium]|nr:hypothetical protein [Clostridia bacterium]
MGCILDKTAFEWDFRVTSFDVDTFNRLRLSSLMKYQQEIGGMHLFEFGTTSERMAKEQNLAFIFTKMNIAIHQLPKAQDKVIMRTWCSGLKGVRFTRNYLLFDENRKLLTEAKVEVTTLDLKTRKIVRPNEINGFSDFLYNDELENMADAPTKLTVPDKLEAVYTRPVRFSDIDYNGHVNNTVYADMSLDCLTTEALKNPLKGFSINFVSEIMPDEAVTLSMAETDSGYTFVGAANDRQSFVARLIF